MTILGVIADTHIPDRMRGLHPEVIPLFEESGVQAILHAGDVSVPRVLEELGEIAPVYAVRGNRDFWRLRYLPLFVNLEFNGVPMVLAHGQGRWWNYLAGKAYYLAYGLQPERYKRRLVESFPQARVIIFGHIHVPINDWMGERLLFNPGTACCPEIKKLPPSVGLLHVSAGGEVHGEVVYLE